MNSKGNIIFFFQFTFCGMSQLRGDVPSAIETHAGALIQVHVGITKETFGHTFHVSRHLIGQLGGRHFQVGADLRAGVNLRDVEAVYLPFSVCHAVEEDPVLAVGSVFDEGHVVARLDAEHGEQLQLVSDQSVRHAATQVTLGDVQSSWLMGPALTMRVHLS